MNKNTNRIRRRRKDAPKKGRQYSLKRVRKAPPPAPILTPREVAVNLFAKWLKNPVRIERVVQDAIDGNKWDKRDSALFFEIMYGAVRWHGRIEWIISQLSRSPNKSHEIAYSAAILGIYQMLFLDRVPDFAVVDASVEITGKVHGKPIAGW